jgi:hypothetical protein
MHESATSSVPFRQIRAAYDDTTIRVYQAYSDAIADSALRHGRFVSPPFKMERMTWIKPSFLWMMYRAGWGLKDASQSRILAIDITREGFEWALSHSCPSHAPPGISEVEYKVLKEANPVRIQWDPERDLHHNPLPHRAIQIGLSKEAVSLYVNEWTHKITDVTSLAHVIFALVNEEDMVRAMALLPEEREYKQLQATPTSCK